MVLPFLSRMAGIEDIALVLLFPAAPWPRAEGLRSSLWGRRVTETEREKQGDRREETERQGDIGRERQRQKDREGETEREMEREAERERQKKEERQRRRDRDIGKER